MTATGDWLWTGGYDARQPLNNTRLYTESGWQNFTELPEAIGLHCQVYVENKGVYVIGGYNDERSLDTTYELTSSNEWSKLSSLNTRRHDHACVEWEGGILAIGGIGYSSVERYDVVSNKWFSFTPLPEVLFYHQAIVWDGDVYVLGGRVVNHDINKVVYKLKKGSQTWEAVPGVSVDLGTDKRSIFPYLITSNIHCNN